MERIKDISKIKLNPGDVILSFRRGENSKIILTGKSKTEAGSTYFAVVEVIGSDVTKAEVGDIVLRPDVRKIIGWTRDDVEYGILPQHALEVIISPDNFTGNGDIAPSIHKTKS